MSKKENQNLSNSKILEWFRASFIYYWFILVILPSIGEAIPLSKIGEKIMEIIISFATSLILILFGVVKIDNLGVNLTSFLVWLALTFVVRVFVGIVYIPVRIYNKQKMENEELGGKLSPQKANIEIEEIHLNSSGFQGYGQATKVGISIENKGNDIIPKIRINEIYVTEKYISDMTTDLLHLEYETCFINFDKIIEYGHTEKIPLMEIRDGGIFLLLNNGLFLVDTKKVFDDFRFRWDLKFEVFGKIKDGNFDNGIYSTFIETKTTGHEIYLQMGEIVKA